MPRLLPNRPLTRSKRTTSGPGRVAFTCMLVIGSSFSCLGCARNHTYIEPNGQVTTVSRDPLFGLRKHSPDTVQMAAVPTEVQGAKVVTVTPAPAGQVSQIGVVNPAIPEAVVVQPPAARGTVAEPPLINGATGANGTQVSGGISPAGPSSAPKVVEGLLD